MIAAMKEVEKYNNFDELAQDVLDLAKEILPDQLIYLTSIDDSQQIILKLSDDDSGILLSEGMAIELEQTVCKRIDFDQKQPLIYENIREEIDSAELRNSLEAANIKSYLGLPISHMNGEKFGTLCVVHHEESRYDKKSVQLLQRIVKMFSYYLELERYAFRDFLTDLYNRHYLSKFYEDHPETEKMIFLLDLDGFKKVNDVHGHDAGDKVLKEVAVRLKEFAKAHEDAFVVRLGGDEFIIHFSRIVSEKEVREHAERLLEELNRWGDQFELSASIGIAFSPADSGIKLTTFLKNADDALYEAKEAGKNTYKIFE